MLNLFITTLITLALFNVTSRAVAEDKAVMTVFAAASLSDPLTTLGKQYNELTGVEVRYSFASSSVLARQIKSGARPELFFCANPRWMDELANNHLIDSQTRTPVLSNTLVVAAPIASPIEPFTLDKDTILTNLLGPGERIAVGDPDHVPAGMYAAAALNKLALWAEVAPLLARADNTRAALALIERGESPIGFVYLTDTIISPGVKILAHIPPDVGEKITYELAVVGKQNDGTMKLLKFLTGSEAAKQYAASQFIVIHNQSEIRR
ncbi:MAG: molybdate ABC transporter substrate-binding protein [Gammaproteobacteria bacterium]